MQRINELLDAERPQLLILDSIQTVYDPDFQSAPGTVVRVRECAAHLTRYAKSSGCPVFLVGHLTKEGTLAGPQGALAHGRRGALLRGRVGNRVSHAAR